jgi:hypothetical protein
MEKGWKRVGYRPARNGLDCTITGCNRRQCNHCLGLYGLFFEIKKECSRARNKWAMHVHMYCYTPHVFDVSGYTCNACDWNKNELFGAYEEELKRGRETPMQGNGDLLVPDNNLIIETPFKHYGVHGMGGDPLNGVRPDMHAVKSMEVAITDARLALLSS